MPNDDVAPAAVSRAVAVLRSGGLVALPTETVYGLAADAENPRAIARVYAVKGRPADHPLILHLAAETLLPEWSRRVPDYAVRLAERLWPGPLTLVLPRSQRVGDWVTGGQDTVAVRVPAHPLALAVLDGFGSAVAAPSANLFGRVSPTSAAHVRADLGALLDAARDLILDGGDCRIGVESTIVDCTGAAPVVLRPGAVSAADIEEVSGVAVAARSARPPRVPGTLAAHYTPKARVRVLGSRDPAPAVDPDGTQGFVALAGIPTPTGAVRLMEPATVADYAQGLYAALREADALMLQRVLALPPPGAEGLAAAIRDRLVRAAAG